MLYEMSFNKLNPINKILRRHCNSNSSNNDKVRNKTKFVFDGAHKISLL